MRRTTVVELSEYSLTSLREDGDFVLYRSDATQAGSPSVLLLSPVSERPTPESLKKIEHEYSFRGELDATWAVRPLAISEYDGKRGLVLEDPGGKPLSHLSDGSIEMRAFLRLGIGIAEAVGQLHKRHIIHKDLKPSNVLVALENGRAWLTGFGIASRLTRERQPLEPPEFIAGTLAYMAPEQTGRMNRSVDSRSDLYALGVTLYELLTGSLPFTASDPMEWVHSHVARQPIPPNQRAKNLPLQVSAIIMKLLAKTPEDRYQTAFGAKRDLERCLAEWENHGSISQFLLGDHDVPDRLLIPEKLYGRAPEIDRLLASFDRIVSGGRPELVLVSGYAGIGKSSVVNELHKVLVPPRALFASGKFDQYKRDIPYATLAQAFQSLILPLLSKSEKELNKWRDAFHEALDPNGQLMVDLVPELKLIIGEQPAVPALPPQDAQGRFQLVFCRFISLFTREHPLALFLDDLQWLDAATLDLMEDLLTRSDVRHLLLVGAYRDNEVSPTHPLMRKLEAIRHAGATMQDIVLAPLAHEDLRQLVADSLHCESERAEPLAQLIHQKTTGNPFFAIQFFSALAEENLLTFDHGEQRWIWDLHIIRAKDHTDNVVDLMVRKLNRLPAETQKTLQLLACMGNSAEFAFLDVVSQDSNEEMHGQLWEAVRADLIFRTEHSYKFLHDRVQEAAYSMIPEELRAEAHLRIGRLLAANTPPEKLEERIFEIVNQLNRGSKLITSAAERVRVAELNFIAGRRAKTSTAYASALKYLTAGRALLTEKAWDENYELIFSIECDSAECELLTADMVGAANRLSTLIPRAKFEHDVAVVTRLRLTLYTTLDRSDLAVEACLEYLRRGDTDWSPHPTSEEVRHEYDRIWSLVGTRQIEKLIDLPLMTNPRLLDDIDVLSEVVTPALFCDENLSSLVICRMVNLSLEHGNSDGSCFAYVWFGIIAGPRFGNYKDGFRFGRLGYDLVEKRGSRRFRARTYMSFGDIVMPWTKHVRAGRDLVRRAFDAANEIGDLTFAAYSCDHLVKNLLAAGDQLADVQLEAEKGLEFAQKVRFGLVIDHITAQLGLIRTLRGVTAKFGSFNDDEFDEHRFERRLASNPALAELECWYWVRKLQAHFFAGDYASAVEASERALRQLWTSPSQFEMAELRFYGALSHAVSWDFASPDEMQKHFEALTTHHKQLEIWAEHCPANFENRVAVVGAEIARIENRVLDAEELYEKAIRSAQTNGFVHNEAVANEVAARFYAARGFEKIARAYLRDARYCYLKWGADGKVRQLSELHPHLKMEAAPAPMSTIETPVELLDLSTVIKVSQTVSTEIDPDKLIDKVMRAAIEHAGATRGLLILSRNDGLRIEAEATTIDDKVLVLRKEAVPGVSPQSIVNYVVRTHESVILDDASKENQFAADSYFSQHHARSVLCLPLITRGKFVGVLYLENTLAPNVFTSNRAAVLKLLASQAAISLENTQLYADLRQREAKIRRLVEADILAIAIWSVDGAIVDSNETFLRLVQYTHEDVASGRVRWMDLTPAEWLGGDERALAQLAQTGTMQPYEKELFRKDGSRVPVLVAGALFEEGGSEGVSFALDLSEQKRAEEALRRSETYLAQAQKLAHIGSWVWEVTGRSALYLSEEWYRIYSFDPKDGMPTWEERLQRVHPEDRAHWQEAMDRAIAERSDYDVQFRLLNPGDRIRFIRSVGRPVKNPSGELLQFVGVAIDLTEQQRAEEALRSSEAYLTESQRLTHTGSCAIDGPSREILYWSDEMFRLFGFNPEQGLPKWDQWVQRIHPEDREKFGIAGDRTFLEKVLCDVQFRIVETNGTIKHIHGICHPVLGPSGELVQVVGTMVDVTERKRAEEARDRVRQLEEEFAHISRVNMMGHLTASLAHEINQPIGAALGNAEACFHFLDRERPGVAEAREAALEMATDVRRAASIVDRVRSLYRKGSSCKEIIDVNEVIKEMVLMLQNQASRHSVMIRTELAEKLPKVLADRVQLQQVMMNLMLNGIEAMESTSGELSIKSQSPEEGQLLVTVIDAGVGLPAGDADRIFNAFFTTKAHGTGLGLAITHSIIESHGGRVWATANPDRGATFQFTLPSTRAKAV
jgi:PAS domain S-box-containing protein